MSTITLFDFAKEQIRVVEKIGQQLRQLVRVNPRWSVEKSIDKLLVSGNPFLKGVSKQELLDEYHFPGSFDIFRPFS